MRIAAKQREKVFVSITDSIGETVCQSIDWHRRRIPISLTHKMRLPTLAHSKMFGLMMAVKRFALLLYLTCPTTVISLPILLILSSLLCILMRGNITHWSGNRLLSSRCQISMTPILSMTTSLKLEQNHIIISNCNTRQSLMVNSLPIFTTFKVGGLRIASTASAYRSVGRLCGNKCQHSALWTNATAV